MASDESSKKDEKEIASGDLKGILGDTVKKVFTAGVSAAFITEESLRAYVSELKLPKEALNLLIQGANKSKEEIAQKVTKEILALVQKVDIAKEASRFVETHKFRITAEIDIIKKEKSSAHGEGRTSHSEESKS